MKPGIIDTELLLYSRCPETQKTLATFIIQAPKFIHTYLNSHRALSKNSASSRALPASVVRRQVLRSPFIPIEFSKNQKGMRGGEKFTGTKLLIARKIWLWSRYKPCFFHWVGQKLKIHKEVLNRLIEPWMYSQVIVSGTEWNNFFKLRTDNAAQPEIQVVAKKMKALLNQEPQILNAEQWHLPFISTEEKSHYSLEDQKMISAARCARVSYLMHDGKRSTPKSDIQLCARLIQNGHWSPFEHVAMALPTKAREGNFIGFKQMRKFYENESNGDYVS